MASAYQIEKNVPVPHRNGGRGNPRFPFHDLAVGDSFHVPWGGEDKLKLRSVLSNAVAAWHLRNSPKRLQTQKDDTGIRVWRVA